MTEPGSASTPCLAARGERSDMLPSFCRAKVLILGVGNVLFGDDGFGPEVINRLLLQYRIPGDAYVMDVGTGARKLLFTLALSEVLPADIVIVDAVDGGRGDGRVGEIPLDLLPVAKLDDFALHQVPSSNLLRELHERRATRITIVACDVGAVPQGVAPGLSPDAKAAVTEACKWIADLFHFAPIDAGPGR